MEFPERCRQRLVLKALDVLKGVAEMHNVSGSRWLSPTMRWVGREMVGNQVVVGWLMLVLPLPLLLQGGWFLLGRRIRQSRVASGELVLDVGVDGDVGCFKYVSVPTVVG